MATLPTYGYNIPHFLINWPLTANCLTKHKTVRIKFPIYYSCGGALSNQARQHICCLVLHICDASVCVCTKTINYLRVCMFYRRWVVLPACYLWVNSTSKQPHVWFPGLWPQTLAGHLKYSPCLSLEAPSVSNVGTARGQLTGKLSTWQEWGGGGVKSHNSAVYSDLWMFFFSFHIRCKGVSSLQLHLYLLYFPSAVFCRNWAMKSNNKCIRM